MDLESPVEVKSREKGREEWKLGPVSTLLAGEDWVLQMVYNLAVDGSWESGGGEIRREKGRDEWKLGA
jgi:hypothetical protein